MTIVTAISVLIVAGLFGLALGFALYLGIDNAHKVLDYQFDKRIRPHLFGNQTSRRDCKILHDTARTEQSVYGKVVSESIQEHLDKCPLTEVYRVFGKR